MFPTERPSSLNGLSAIPCARRKERLHPRLPSLLLHPRRCLVVHHRPGAGFNRPSRSSHQPAARGRGDRRDVDSAASELGHRAPGDAKNEAGTTRGAIWSFTNAEPTADPTLALSAPEWSQEARKKITGVVHVPINVTIPAPAGNPDPSVTVRGGIFDFNAGSLTLSSGDLYYAQSGTVVLTASNSQGSSELSVPYSVTCGYSQNDVINLWIGTHSLPRAPSDSVPNFSVTLPVRRSETTGRRGATHAVAV